MRRVVVLALLLVVPLSGCLGGEARTDWAFDITGLDEAYADGHRGAGVTVAVLDTGVNVDHPSLDHLVDGKERNGELVAFKDFLGTATEVKDAFDDNGHGSHVVGILSARGSDFGDKLVYGGVDLLGASPNVRLVVARVCGVSEDDSGKTACDETVIDDAVRWAVNVHGADVVSLSLGGGELPLLAGVLTPQEQQIEDAIRNAIDDAIDGGTVVVAAAGNDGPDNDDVSFPASIPGVIAVGAIGSGGEVADFSNRGDPAANGCRSGGFFGDPASRCAPHQKPEIMAPGVGILSAWTEGSYVKADGTSQATPFVSAAVALLLEGRPDLDSRSDVQTIKRVLMDTAKPVPGQTLPHDDASGYGVLQAHDALRAYG